MREKYYNIILSVLSIGTMILILVTLTFAYFIPAMEGNEASVSTVTKTMGIVTFNGGADFTTSNKIIPSWSEAKTFTISMGPTDISQRVLVKMDYVNEMPGLTCEVTPSTSGAVSNISINSDNISTTVTLVDVTFEPSTTSKTNTYTLTMALPETGEPQNDSQGKTFTARMYAELGDDSLYYNYENPNGTITPPNS